MTDATWLVEAHLIVHLYAPTDGPHASAAYHALEEIWSRCRQMFAMTNPITSLDLPHHLPETREALPLFPHLTIPELAIAAQERPDSTAQALVRRHHDVLNMSVAIPVEIATDEWPGWHGVERHWEKVAGHARSLLLGEARIYLASLKPHDPACGLPLDADSARQLRPYLPVGPEVDEWWLQSSEAHMGCTLWEISDGDTRDRRRILVLADADRDPQVSALLWSRGDAAIPPLARYLLHAAKLRYALRVWQHDRDSVMTATHNRAGEVAAQVAALRRTVEIVTDNMERSLGIAAITAADRGMFHDDRGLAAWFATQLADDAAYLETARSQLPRPAIAALSDAEDSFDPRRVFVVHGRDEQARKRMFDFLYRLGLIPLEWEILVTATGSATPDLRAPIARGLALCGAVVVVMTPDDSVLLHPSLRLQADSPDETCLGQQARPNVLFELGMAYDMYPTRTIITVAGHMRGVADLAALNVVRLDDSISCEHKSLSRLHIAGCPAQNLDDDDRRPGHFSGLDAWTRRPVGPPHSMASIRSR